MEKMNSFVAYNLFLDTGVPSLTFQPLLQFLTNYQSLEFKYLGPLGNRKIIQLSTDRCFVQFIFNFKTHSQNLIYRHVQINI